MKRDKGKQEWIKIAMADRKDELKDDELTALKQKIDENALDDAINILKKNAQEVEVDEEIKNTIGNLTLLDAATNRMYGNSLFCTKRRIIIERIKQGVFVPMQHNISSLNSLMRKVPTVLYGQRKTWKHIINTSMMP